MKVLLLLALIFPAASHAANLDSNVGMRTIEIVGSSKFLNSPIEEHLVIIRDSNHPEVLDIANVDCGFAAFLNLEGGSSFYLQLPEREANVALVGKMPNASACKTLLNASQVATPEKPVVLKIDSATGRILKFRVTQ